MLLIALSYTFERQARAYVDPGSGLLIFQGINAAGPSDTSIPIWNGPPRVRVLFTSP